MSPKFDYMLKLNCLFFSIFSWVQSFGTCNVCREDYKCWKATHEARGLFIIIYRFQDRREENKRFWIEWYEVE